MVSEADTSPNNGASARTHVSLVIRGFNGAPSRITDEIGIEPSQTGAKGEPRVTTTGKITDGRNKDSFWSLRSTASPRAPVDVHMATILEMVKSHAKRLRELRAPVTKQIYCTIIPGDAVPLIVFGPQVLAGLAELGVEVVVDVLSVDERPG